MVKFSLSLYLCPNAEDRVRIRVMAALKRMLMVITVVALMLAFTVVPAAAQNSDFIIENGILSRYNGSGGNVVIPEGLGITSIGDNAFSKNDSIVSVVIPNGVTSIMNWCFSGCTNLKSVSIPNGVRFIASFVFENCKNLKSLSIPETVENLGIGFLTGTSIPEPVLLHNGKTLCYVPAWFTSYQIPETVTEIVGGTFRNCAKLTSITIPPSITKIMHWTFRGCTSLTSVTIPDSVTHIYTNALYDCSALTSISIPESVVFIDASVFTGTSIKTPILSNDGTTLCYVPSTVTSFQIPDTVTAISGGAFLRCAALTEIVVPERVTQIDRQAFSGCTGLSSVTLPTGLGIISSDMFSRCTNLKTVAIPNTVTSIEEGAFYGCSALKTINIPSGVTSIGRVAFYDCSSLKALAIPSGVKAIGDNVISTRQNTTLYVFNGSVAEEYARQYQYPYVLEKASPNEPTVIIDGKTIDFGAFVINGNNYFKLRDLAMALNGTAKQFNIVWDASNNAIILVLGTPYTPVGGELAITEGRTSVIATLTTSKVYMNGVEAPLSGYRMGCNNYFKLRDIAALLDFSVIWDDATRAIRIDTSISYTPG